MKKIDVKVTIEELAYAELNERERSLVDAAREATHRSYAPYSKFNVGAAIWLDNGEMVTGSNQENAAYPSGLCAERTTAFYAHSRYPEARFKMLAIAARDGSGEFVAEPVSPCGACRQSLLQYEMLAEAPVEVLLVGATTVYRLPSIRSLLPLAFTEF
jgi:cytidine deaminase